MKRYRHQDIEIPLELMEDLSSHRTTPLHVMTSRSAADIFTMDDGRSSKYTPRLPSISTTPVHHMMSSMPSSRAHDARLANRSQQRRHRDQHLPYSVLRGYVLKEEDGNKPVLMEQDYTTPAQQYMNKREQKVLKEKSRQQRSR